MDRFNLALTGFAARQSNSAVSGTLKAHTAKTMLATTDGFILRMTEALHFLSPFATHSNPIRVFRETGNELRKGLSSRRIVPLNPKSELERATRHVESRRFGKGWTGRRR